MIKRKDSNGSVVQKVGRTVAVTGAVAGLAYVGGSYALGKKTKSVLDDGIDGLADDLTHILTHEMSSSDMEERIALRGHGNCAATRYNQRRVPMMPMHTSGSNLEGPDF